MKSQSVLFIYLNVTLTPLSPQSDALQIFIITKMLVSEILLISTLNHPPLNSSGFLFISPYKCAVHASHLYLEDIIILSVDGPFIVVIVAIEFMPTKKSLYFSQFLSG